MALAPVVGIANPRAIGSAGYRPVGPMTDIVRPFLEARSTPKPRELSLPAGDEPEAYIEWGGPSQFEVDNFEEAADQHFGFRVEDTPADDIPEFVYRELGRRVTEVRVENPDDPDQFVIVERIDEILFDGKGRRLRLVLRN